MRRMVRISTVKYGINICLALTELLGHVVGVNRGLNGVIRRRNVLENG